MINRIKREDFRTSITGIIGEAEVSIIYESIAGNPPLAITATGSIKGSLAITGEDGAIIPAIEGCFLNITRDSYGGKNVNISGKISITDVEGIINELEAEIEAIAASEVAVK